MDDRIQTILRQELDQRAESLHSAHKSAVPPARGWLRAIREALGLAQAQVASRLGVTRQSLAQFETAEATESITLASLRRAAGAMDCELVYYLLPRRSMARDFTGLARTHDEAAAHCRATEHSESLGDPGGAE